MHNFRYTFMVVAVVVDVVGVALRTVLVLLVFRCVKLASLSVRVVVSQLGECRCYRVCFEFCLARICYVIVMISSAWSVVDWDNIGLAYEK